MTRHKHRRPKLQSFYLWHRYLGLAVALPVLLLAVTGLMLNHTEQLRLDQQPIHQRWLLGWYGIEPVEARFFRVGEQWLGQRDERLYLDTTELPFSFHETLVGAVRTSDTIVAAGPRDLLLLMPDGRLIERLDTAAGVPETIHTIAIDTAARIVLQTESGIHRSDLMSDDWQAINETAANWSRTEAPPEALKQSLRENFPGASLPLERIILDLHSGRLFGDWGGYVMDAAAILLLFNAASGVLLWWRRRRQQHNRTAH